MEAGRNALVLDSCAVIEHFKQNAKARDLLRQADTLYLPIVAYGELYFGALNSGNPEKKLEQVSDFVQIVTLLYPNKNTALNYAEIRLKLAKKGTPIPENDLWIAAIAKQYELPLMSNDEKHFTRISDLDLLTF